MDIVGYTKEENNACESVEMRAVPRLAPFTVSIQALLASTAAHMGSEEGHTCKGDWYIVKKFRCCAKPQGE